MVYGWLAQPLRLLPRWKGWAVYMPFEDPDDTDRRMALTIARRLAAAEPSEQGTRS
jgi:hypothetical protein